MMFRQAQHTNKKSTLNLPKGWEMKKLIEVCKFQNGFAFKSKTFKDSGTPVVRITNIQNEVLDLEKIVYVDRTDYDKDLTKYEIVKGDLLIAMSGATTGKIGIHKSDEVLLLNQRVGKFESLEDLLNEYLFYFLSTKVEESLNISAGSAQPNLSTEQIKSFQIPIPPIEEQKQIIAILDKAFTAIDQAKANISTNIANANELFQSKLNEIFSHPSTGSGGKANTEPAEVWEEKSLGDVCYVLNGYAFKSKEAIEDSNTQLLRMGNLYKNVLDLSRKPVFYPDKYSDEYKDFLLKEGDLIMSLTGTVDKTDYGYTVKIPEIEVDLLLNQRIMKIEVHDSNILNKDYLKNYLLSPDFLMRLYDTASGTRQANLSSRTILTLKINYPIDIGKQLKIVKQFKLLRDYSKNIEAKYLVKLNSLEELKKSILQKAFAGELTQKEVLV